MQTRWDGEIGQAGIFKDSKWPGLHESMEKWADDNGYLKLPGLKYLFVPGSWVWLYLLLAGWWLRHIYPTTIVFPFLLSGGTMAPVRYAVGKEEKQEK